MKDLDNIAAMKKIDLSGVLESTAKFADQCQQAWNESSTLRFSEKYDHIYNIVVCGMGGSRFTPRTIKELYLDRIKEPYEIVEDYTLPSYVDKDTLVILSSYSGTTEEVVSCGYEAIKRGARISAVTSGAKIGEMLEEYDSVGYVFKPIHNPCGQPRIGSGYMLMGHLGLLYALKLIDFDTKDVSNAIDFARTLSALYQSSVSSRDNTAKQLALFLKDRHPFIITAEFLKGFGNCFSNQINETSKMISDYRYISELNHHMLDGLKHPETLHQNGVFLFVLSPLYSEPIRKRFSITKDVVEKQNVTTREIRLTAPTKLAQVLEAYTLSGFITFYMAMLYDTDPAAIPWVDYFKKKLAGS
ncbi:hypothetical protein KJ618_01570 [Patescibacteria group bacterium]|nr:hypothetical protein [Patescibacteria group bacterium]